MGFSVHPEDLTTEWLAGALQRSGARGLVTGFETEVLGGTKGA